MTGRRKRGSRARPTGRLLLQPRDVEILLFVGRAGVARLPDIATLFWPGRPSANVLAARRLRRMTDHGLIETGAHALHEPNRLTLTAQGAERVPSEGYVLRTRIRPFSQAADHLVATAAVWSSVAVRLRRRPGPRLLRFVTEAEIRRALGRTERALIPDGLFIIGSTTRTVTFALEVDLGTEVAAVLAGKMRRYALHLGGRAPLYGLRVDALLVVARGRLRLKQLAEAALRSGTAPWSFFQDLDGLCPERVLDRLAVADALLTRSEATAADPFTVSLLGGAA